jgi:hypothetical protein
MVLLRLVRDGIEEERAATEVEAGGAGSIINEAN